MDRNQNKTQNQSKNQQNNADDGEAAHMGILQDLPAALQTSVRLHRIGHIHVPVQMEKARGKVGIHTQNQRRHQLREHPADAGQPPPDQAQLQTHDGQKQEHLVLRLLIPDLGSMGNMPVHRGRTHRHLQVLHPRAASEHMEVQQHTLPQHVCKIGEIRRSISPDCLCSDGGLHH